MGINFMQKLAKEPRGEMSDLRNKNEKRMDKIQRELEVKSSRDTIKILNDDMDVIRMEIDQIKHGTQGEIQDIQDIKQTQNIFADQVKNLMDSTNTIKKEILKLESSKNMQVEEKREEVRKEIDNILKSEAMVKEAIENYGKFYDEVKDLERLSSIVNQIEQDNDIKIKEGIKNIEDKFSEFKAEVDNQVSDGLSGVHQALIERTPAKR